MEQPKRDPIWNPRIIMARMVALSVFLRSKDSVNPPEKSSRASAVVPPSRFSYEP